MQKSKHSPHKKGNKLVLVSFFACVLVLSSNLGAQARERYMEAYVDFPQALEEYKYDCQLCHFSSKGGGGRKKFGKAFRKNKKKFDEDLIKLFPKYFKQ